MTSLDFYKGFDAHFFFGKNKETAAHTYKNFLEQYGDLLNDMLANPLLLIQERSFYTDLKKAGKDEIVHILNLQKPPRLTITLEDITNKSGVQLVGEQRRFAAGNVQYHLARLMFPLEYCHSWNDLHGIKQHPVNNACDYFGKEFIQYLATIPQEIIVKKDYDAFQEVVGLDGSDFFWTLAPYVHLNLQERGISSHDSIARIIKWVTNKYEKDRAGFHNLSRQFPFARLIEQENMICFNPLGYDERMPSHLRARLLAREVAKELAKW